MNEEPFTLEEYIRANGLGVSHLDPQATRIIAEHLRKKGYVVRTMRLRGVRRRFWQKAQEGEQTYEQLKKKLEEMQ